MLICTSLANCSKTGTHPGIAGAVTVFGMRGVAAFKHGVSCRGTLLAETAEAVN